MSAYIVDDKTINSIITTIYLKSLGVGNFSFYRLKMLGYYLHSKEDCKRLAEEMFALNIDAVEQRYGKGEAKTFRPLDFKFQFTKNVGIVKTIKALNEWLYQCLEGTVPEMKLYQEMDNIRNSMYVKFAHSTKEWIAAEGNK